MAGSEAPALRKLPGTATPIRLPRQPPTLPPSAIDLLQLGLQFVAVVVSRGEGLGSQGQDDDQPRVGARVGADYDGIFGAVKDALQKYISLALKAIRKRRCFFQDWRCYGPRKIRTSCQRPAPWSNGMLTTISATLYSRNSFAGRLQT